MNRSATRPGRRHRPMGAGKRFRQQLILEIVHQRPVGSQVELVAALADRGVATNQATVSRDLKEMGLVRVHDPANGARYLPPSEAQARTWESISGVLSEHVQGVDWNPLLIVVKTGTGAAHMVGVAVDGLREPDIVGTVAGDDTLLVVPRSEEARERLVRRLRGQG